MTEQTTHHERKNDEKKIEEKMHKHDDKGTAAHVHTHESHDAHHEQAHGEHANPHDHTHHDHSHDHKEEKKAETANEQKKEAKKEKPKTQAKPKREKAMAQGLNLPVSKRQCMYIGAFIKNKQIDQAIADLHKVIALKKAVPFKGEIPHRKGKGIMSGRYPVKASEIFIKLLRGLRGNILANGMSLEDTRITIASANLAHRPQRSRSRKGKRCHVILEAREVKV